MATRTVRIQLFGSPAVEIDGEPASLSRHKAIALLAFLAVSDGAYARDYLAALLWPEQEPGAARSGLRQALAEINRVLGHGIVLADRQNVAFNPAAGAASDVHEFREVYTAFQRGPREPDAAVLERTVRVAAPGFLEGFSLPDCPAFDDWQQEVGTALREQLFDLARRLIEALRQRGEMRRALEAARELVSLDPLDEGHQRLLMTLLSETGDRNGALRQFARCSSRLEAELGVEPEPETIALYERIQRPDPEAAAVLSTVGTPAAAKRSKRRRRTPVLIALIAAGVLSASAIALIAPARGWITVPAPARGSLAVLPVKPWCGDPEAEGYCEVMTHELITTLAAQTPLKVTPQASVRQYRNTVKRIPDIARELEVRYVLDIAGFREGSVLLFSVQLIYAARDECVWAAVFTGAATDPLSEQQRIVQEVAEWIERELL